MNNCWFKNVYLQDQPVNRNDILCLLFSEVNVVLEELDKRK